MSWVMLYANQKYARHMSSEQRDFMKLNILHETEIVGKQFSDDSDEQLKDQQTKVASRVASRVPENIF